MGIGGWLGKGFMWWLGGDVFFSFVRVLWWLGGCVMGWVTGFLVAGWVYGWMCVTDCLDRSFRLFGGMGGVHDGWMGLLVLDFFCAG